MCVVRRVRVSVRVPISWLGLLQCWAAGFGRADAGQAKYTWGRSAGGASVPPSQGIRVWIKKKRTWACPYLLLLYTPAPAVVVWYPQISLQLGLESVTNMSKDLANISKKNKALSKRYGGSMGTRGHRGVEAAGTFWLQGSIMNKFLLVSYRVYVMR